MNTLIYIKNGKLDDDFGTGVTVATREVSSWIKFDTENLGYMPEVVTEEEYLEWKERIATPDFVVYFPGLLPGVGVVDKATYEMLQARRKAVHSQYRFVTLAQARRWLIENDKDDVVLAAVREMLVSDDPETVKQGKRLHVLVEYATEWRRPCPLCAALLEIAGVDKDKFFEEAAKL